MEHKIDRNCGEHYCSKCKHKNVKAQLEPCDSCIGNDKECYFEAEEVTQ